MRKQGDILKKTIDRYENALNILYYTLQSNNNISITKFILNNGLSKNTPVVLYKNGILKTNNKRGRACKYYWNTIKPTKDMAVSVIKEVNDIGYREKIKRDNNEDEVKKRGGKRNGAGRPNGSINVRSAKKVITKSLLWGLYSYKETIK